MSFIVKKTRWLLILFLLVLMCICYNCNYSSSAPSSAQPSPDEWVEGGYLERGDIYVCSSGENINNDPWAQEPNVFGAQPLDGIALRKGWSRLTADRAMSLSSAHCVRMVIALVSDNRWTRFSPMEAKISGDRAELLVSMKTFTGIREKSYMPSLWSESALLTTLKYGQTYSIYLGQTFKGKINTGGKPLL